MLPKSDGFTCLLPALTGHSLLSRALRCSFTEPVVRPSCSIFERQGRLDHEDRILGNGVGWKVSAHRNKVHCLISIAVFLKLVYLNFSACWPTALGGHAPRSKAHYGIYLTYFRAGRGNDLYFCDLCTSGNIYGNDGRVSDRCHKLYDVSYGPRF